MVFANESFGVSGGSHYDALCVSEDASQDSIRRQFLAAALALHPDKQNHGSKIVPDQHTLVSLNNHPSPRPNLQEEVLKKKVAVINLDEGTPDDRRGDPTFIPGDSDVQERFLRVQQAWAVLKDPSMRAAYDRSIQEQARARGSSSSRGEVAVSDEMELEEMSQELDEDAHELLYSHFCRCGDEYTLLQSDVDAAIAAESRSWKGPASLVPPPMDRVGILVQCGSCSLHIRILCSNFGNHQATAVS
eukprot:jgi/Mesen1/7605/ME000395S06757